jgi:hypothetical protein
VACGLAAAPDEPVGPAGVALFIRAAVQNPRAAACAPLPTVCVTAWTSGEPLVVAAPALPPPAATPTATAKAAADTQAFPTLRMLRSGVGHLKATDTTILG